MPYLGNRPDNIVIRNAQQEFNYTATSSQTTFTGLDSNNNTLAYNPGNVEVFFNGARLEEADFTATNGTSVVLASAAATNDLVSIVSTDVFEVTDTVSRQNGGTFIGDVTMSGNLTVNGTTTSVNSNEVNIGDNILKLNSDEAGTPSQNAGIEIERGTSTNVVLRWNETTDKWQFTNDGSSYEDIGAGISVQEEGSALSTAATTLNFVGSNVTATGSGATKTITIGGGDVVADTTPQLGGDLDTNSKNIAFGDSSGATVNRLTFGAGSDLVIYHDNSTNKSHITESGTSHLIVQGQEIQFKNASGTNLMALNSAQCELFFSGSKKMETNTNGIAVTGTITSTGIGQFNDYIDLNTAGNRGKIGYDSNNVYIGSTASAGQIIFKNGITSTDAPQTSGTDRMVIDASGNVTTKGRGLTVDNVDASWHAINIAESIDNRIAFRITPTRVGQTKGISMGAIGLASSDTGLQAYDTSNNSANDFLINPWGGNVGIGITTGPGTSLHIKDAITNPNTISSNITIPASSNSMMAGPITLNATVTIPSGSSWTIV